MRAMRWRRSIRAGVIILYGFVWFSAHAGQNASQASFESLVRPFILENCAGCHGARLQSGGLDLGSMSSVDSVRERREVWERVREKLRLGEMPPKGAPRPDPESVRSVIHWLEVEFERADRAIRPDPGRVTARRLNRAEYNHTVQDLLGVDLSPADEFPQDDSGYGFDTIGEVLTLPPVLMEKYLTAAERVARRAVFGPEPLKASLFRPRLLRGRVAPSKTPLLEYDRTGLSLLNSIHFRYRFPATADYSFRAFLGGTRPLGSDPIRIGLWVDGSLRRALDFDPAGVASFSMDEQDFGGMVRDFRERIGSGEHWISLTIMNLYEGLPAAYGGPNPSRREPPPFVPPPNAAPQRVEQLRREYEARLAARKPVNDARVTNVEIGGPYNQVPGPSRESLERLYPCGHFDGRHGAGCAAGTIARLARRAWRRPVRPEEVERLTAIVRNVERSGDSFEEGLVVAIEAMLVSPRFLFRMEQERPATAGSNYFPVSQFELASRLSYFIWSSMPDDELLALAERGTLGTQAVFAAQVRRMLADPKSARLVENFGGQWLELRKLESFRPDPDRFPEFDEYLRMSMRRETELFFQNIVRGDLPVTEFLDARYSFVNERLAAFYGIPGVTGPDYRRVSFDEASHRGGIITQASVLAVSSYATRTSPVLRGKWILENILNTPPPPPPPDVPSLDDSKVGSAASLRQKLEEHRRNPICSSCHSRMDPLGFGLENFNAIGAWRTADGSLPIDPSGVLPDGRKFNGPSELRSIISAEREAFADGLAEKMMIYALGRGLERYDKPELRKISARMAASGYRFSSLVLGIAESLPFRQRRAALPAARQKAGG